MATALQIYKIFKIPHFMLYYENQVMKTAECTTCFFLNGNNSFILIDLDFKHFQILVVKNLGRISRLLLIPIIAAVSVHLKQREDKYSSTSLAILKVLNHATHIPALVVN